MNTHLKYALFVATLCVSCAVNPVTGKKDFMLLSEQEEIKMGKEADPSIVASFGLYEDAGLASLLESRGQEMAAISHRPHLKYEFKVLDSPVVNAFAVPGGYVYFTRGILAHFNNEAEFAGVLGHELGHVTARHSAKQYSSQLLFQAGFIAGLVISPDFAAFSDLTQQAVGLLFLKFSRENESQSDELGVEYSTKIGYDAKEMAHFFETIGRLSGESGPIPDFLSTHPNPADRYASVDAMAKRWQSETNTDFKVGRDQYLDLINGMVYGIDPRNGFIESDVFYHPRDAFFLPLPGGWSTNVTSTRLMAAHESGDALFVFGKETSTDIEEALNSTIESLNLTVISKASKDQNGLESIHITAVQKNPQNPLETYPFTITFYNYNGAIYRALGVATQQVYGSFESLLTETVMGMQILDDVEKLNVQPDRLAIQQLEKGGRLDQLLQEYGIPEERLEEFAVLNGKYLDDQLNAGERIKILRSTAGS